MNSQNYQSLTDPNLNAYFNNRRIRRHLIKAGLINRHGDILPPPAYELALATRIKRRQAKEKLSDAVSNYVIEEERRRQAFIRNQFDFAIKRNRVQKIREAQHHQSRLTLNSIALAPKSPSTRNARTPSPSGRKRSPIRAKSVAYPAINLKPQLIRRSSKKKHTTKTDACEVTMIYYGSDTAIDHKTNWSQPYGDEIIVMQQHCGGENLVVFKGFVKSNQIFSFESRRHRDYPFAVAIYINGLINLRISVCCEYKHKPHVRLGSKTGLFAIHNVQKSTACPSCQLEKRMKGISQAPPIVLNPSPYRTSFVNFKKPTAGHHSTILLRTPSQSSDSTKDSMEENSVHRPISPRPDIIPRIRSATPLQSSSKSDSDPKNVIISNSQSPTEYQPKIENPQPIHAKDDRRKLSSASSNTPRASATKPIASTTKSDTPRQLFTDDAFYDQSKKTDSSGSSQNENSFSRFKSPPLIENIRRKTPTPSPKSPSSSDSSETDDDDDNSLAKLSENEKIYTSTSKSSLNESTADIPSQPSPRPNKTFSRDNSSHSLLGTKKSEFFEEDDDKPNNNLSGLSTDSSTDSSTTDFYKRSNTNQVTVDDRNDGHLSSSSSTSISSSKRNDAAIPEGGKPRLNKSSSSSSSTVDEGSHHSKKEKLSSPSSSTGKKTSHHSKKDEFNSSHSSKSSKETTPRQNDQTSQDLEAERSSRDESRKETSEPTPVPQSRNQNKYSSETTIDKSTVRKYRPMENVAVAWLDAIADNEDDEETRNTKNELQKVARIVRTFSDVDKCLQWIKEIKNEKVFLVVSGQLSKTIIEQVDTCEQVVLIYIYCERSSNYEHLVDENEKVKGVYTDIDEICELFKVKCKQWDNDLNTFQITSVNDMQQSISERLLFAQNQLFKEYFIEIPYDNSSIEDLVDYCSNLYTENKDEIDLLNEFKTKYTPDDALYWYAKDCCIYHLLNRAIRMKDMPILYQLGFFIHDVNKQLENNYLTEKPRFAFSVFRGQGMTVNYFDELKQNQGGLISFNGFVSTSTNQEVAHEFAKRSLSHGFPVAVLFHIKIDPSNNSYPFSLLENISSHKSEYEILFSFKAIFHIESLEEIENNIWLVNLTTINHNQHSISNYIAVEAEKFHNLNGYEKLAQLLIQMNELNKAKELYEMNIPLNTDPQYIHVYSQLGSICSSLNDNKQALLYYKIALHTKSTDSLNDHATISNIHNEIGKLLYENDRYDEALEHFHKALNIQSENLSEMDPALVNTYGNLGMFYQDKEDYETALEYLNNKLEVQNSDLNSDQSDLALTHFNIGLCLENLNRFSEALVHVQESIDMTSFNDTELDNRQAALERIRDAAE